MYGQGGDRLDFLGTAQHATLEDEETGSKQLPTIQTGIASWKSDFAVPKLLPEPFARL